MPTCKKIERCDEIEDLKMKIRMQSGCIEEYEKENENLKSCGNCKQRDVDDDTMWGVTETCKLKKNHRSNCRCKKWESDGLSRKDREV
jgi:hypothetical protein